MTQESNTIRQLRQTNRLLMLGYVLMGVLGIAGFAWAQADDPDDPDADPDAADAADEEQIEVPDVVVNATTNQLVAGVGHEMGFAVYVREDGQINIIHRDGTVLVPNRKKFSHVYQEEQQKKDKTIFVPNNR
ncbi:MAG: hypothetical protein ACE37H_01975 [Phycisphaeraceae bacterium]